MQILFLLYGMTSILILAFPKLLKTGFKDREQRVYPFFALGGLPGHNLHQDCSQLQLVQRFLHQHFAAESSWVKIQLFPSRSPLKARAGSEQRNCRDRGRCPRGTATASGGRHCLWAVRFAFCCSSHVCLTCFLFQ